MIASKKGSSVFTQRQRLFAELNLAFYVLAILHGNAQFMKQHDGQDILLVEHLLNAEKLFSRVVFPVEIYSGVDKSTLAKSESFKHDCAPHNERITIFVNNARYKDGRSI